MPLPIPNDEFNFYRDLNSNNGFIFKPDVPANIAIQGDINADGRDDFLVKFYESGELFIYFGKENDDEDGSKYYSRQDFLSPHAPDAIITNSHSRAIHSYKANCDFNGDNITDLVVHSEIPDHGVYYYFYVYVIFGGDWLVPNTTIDVATTNFNGLIFQETADTYPVLGITGLFCADITGDDVNDFVLKRDTKLYVIYNTPRLDNGHYFLDTLDGNNGTCIDLQAAPQSITIGDVDADNRDDLVMMVPAEAGAMKDGYFQTDILFGRAIDSGLRQTSRSALMQQNGGVSIYGLDTSVGYYYSNFPAQYPPKLVKPTDLDGDSIADVIITNKIALPPYGAINVAKLYSLGQVYVLMGHPNLGKERIIFLNDAVSNREAYRLDGVKLCSYLGESGTTFDMNNDGHSDIVLSLPRAAYDMSAGVNSQLVLSGEFPGELNLLYGGGNFTQWFEQDLNQIRGLNGFRITFDKKEKEYPGSKLASKGDVNGDGMIDLLFSLSPAYNSKPFWQKYGVLYGNAWPLFHINQLMVYKGQEVLLNVSNLNVTDANDPNDNLDIIVDFVDNGYFARENNKTIPLTIFKQGWIHSNEMVFIPQGSLPPKYALNATDGKMMVGPIEATVTYSSGLVWMNQHLPLIQGQNTTITADMLRVTDDVSGPETLSFQVIDTQSCYLAFRTQPDQAIFLFSQHQINSNDVCLVGDGTRNTPAVTLNGSNGFMDTGSITVDISYRGSSQTATESGKMNLSRINI